MTLFIVALSGLSLSLLIAAGIRSHDRRLLEAELDRRSSERVYAIEQELWSALNHVQSTAALFEALDTVNPPTFRVFATPVLEGHPAIQALGFNPVVRHSQREEHERARRRSGYPQYRITERSPEGRLVAAAQREEYVVVAFLEPLTGNEAALGYDIASEPVRREALDRARDSGRSAITGRLALVQEIGDEYGVLICVPVYDGKKPTSVAQRRKQLRGFGVGALGIGRFIELSLAHLRPTGINLTIIDDSAPENRETLYYHRSRSLPATETEIADGADSVPEFARSYGFEIAGRRWRVEATPTPAFVDAHRGMASVLALVVGVLLSGALVGYLARQGAINDRLRRAITERNRAEQRLTGFGRVLDEAHNEIYIFDAESLRFQDVNRGARENLGYSKDELLRMTPLELKTEMDPDTFSGLLQPLRDGTVRKIEFTARHRRKDGSFYDVEVHLQLTGQDAQTAFVAVIVDITERLQLEQQMRQAQRLEALGTLAGGMAHDVNNLLMAIMGHSELGLAKSPPDSALQRHYAEVLRASERARDVVRQILTFSRRNPVERRTVDLGAILNEALGLIHASLPANITVRHDVSGAGTIEGDPSQIHQVLMNLCTNAAQAMAGSGGLLEVWVDAVELDGFTARRLGGLEPGSYSRISVRDNGPGISPEVLNRVFDPFFTTKKRDEGTGMGLAVAHGIIRNHGGMMIVSSEIGCGATFETYLPIAGDDILPKTGADEVAESRGERILLVDDEPAVAEVLGDMLRHAGYRVEARQDAEEALKVLQVRPEEFDLVITDYSMPKINGAALAETLAQQPIAPPVILVSGYGELVDENEIARARISELLTKPIRGDQLSAAIRRVLDG